MIKVLGRGFERVVKWQMKCMRSQTCYIVLSIQKICIMILNRLSRIQQPRCGYTEDTDSCIRPELGFYGIGNERTKTKNISYSGKPVVEMMDYGVKAGEGQMARKQ